MRWKLYSLIVILAYLMATVPPLKVRAQSLVEVAIFAVVALGIGTDETAQIHFARANNSRDPQPSEDPLVGFKFIIEVSNVLDGSCRQTFEKALLESTIFGLPMLSVTKGFDQGAFMTISDGTMVEKHDLLPCFDNGRIGLLVGVPVPPDRVAEFVANPNTVPVGVRVPKAAWYSIVGPNRETRASSASLRLGYILSQDSF